jgi:histidinol-phosphate aminotransferase
MSSRQGSTIDRSQPRLTRRELARIVTGGVALGWAGLAGGARAHAAEAMLQDAALGAGRPAAPVLFRLSSNENNYGLAPAAVEALKSGRSYANRYGGESTQKLADAIAAQHGVPRDHVLLTPGSGEILRAVTLAFTSPAKALLTATPSYESPVRTARSVNSPIQSVPVDARGALDLTAMAGRAAASIGLAFICNPNNPTGAINPAAAVRTFMAGFRAASPEGYVLVDEAYFDYVTDPSFATAVPLALADPRVIVSRTFSKIHGMAGLRVGYAIAHPDTLALVRARTSSGTLSSVSAGAALASLEDGGHLTRQRELNRAARDFTRRAFEKAGYAVFPSEGNFVMVDVRRESTVFQQMCREAGVAIARPFPPLTTHARITIGTVEEMKKAVALMLPLLSAPARTAASSGDEDECGC